MGIDWTGEQRRLIDTLVRAYMANGAWPVYQWVDSELVKAGLNTSEVIDSFPVLGGSWTRGQRYCDVRVIGSSTLPQEGDRVALSVRAMSRIPAVRFIADCFSRLLYYAAELRSSARFDPTCVVHIQLTSDDFVTYKRGDVTQTVIDEVYELLGREPLYGFGSRSKQPDKRWTVQLGPDVLRYRGIDLDSYVEMVEKELARPREVPQPRVLSNPLDLALSLGYLDATWQLHSKHPLLQIQDPVGLTTLAYGVISGDEYTARCSALGDILKALQAPSVPGVSGHALSRLRAYLMQQLSADDNAMIDDVFDRLDCIRRARNARTHAATASDGQLALEQLGAGTPPYDWSVVWSTVQTVTADTLMDLRALVANLPRR